MEQKKKKGGQEINEKEAALREGGGDEGLKENVDVRKQKTGK